MKTGHVLSISFLVLASAMLVLTGCPKKPAIGLSTESFKFQVCNTDLTGKFVISNTGGGKLSWSVSTDKSWLSVETDSTNVIKKGGEVRATLTVAAAKLTLAQGSSETGTITVSESGGSSKSLTVTVTKNCPDGGQEGEGEGEAVGEGEVEGEGEGEGETNAFPVIVQGAGPLDVSMSEDGTPVAWTAPTLSATDQNAGDALAWSVSSPATYGVATVSGIGASPTSFNYTPDQDWSGTDTFTVQVSDGKGGTDQIDVRVTVVAVNDPPVIAQANPQTLLAPMNTAVHLNLTATDLEGDTLIWSILTSASNGTASVGSDGRVTYTPNTGYTGSDSFVVQVDDSAGGTDTLTVNVTVNTDQLPVIAQAGPLTVTMSEDGVPVAWAAPTLSATDPDVSDTLSWSVSAQASHGVAIVSGTGTSPSVFVYTPEANFGGPDAFTVQVSDGNGGIAEIDVQVTVTAVNDAPVITGQGALGTPEDTLLTLTLADLTVTDIDNAYPVGFSLNILDGTNYTHVGAAITPALNFIGILTVPVTVSDGITDSPRFDISVTVTAVNDPPVITGQATLSTPEDTPITLTLANLTVADVDNPDQTGFALNVMDGTNYTHLGAAITPASNFNGVLTVPVTVNDGTSDSSSFDVVITVIAINDAPVITGQATLSTPEDTTLTLTLADLTVTDMDNAYPTGFSLIVADGANYTHVDATITPATNFNGILTVPVAVNDGSEVSASFDVIVLVTAVNDVPTITGQAALGTPEDTPLTLTLADLSVNDADNTYPTGFSLSVLDGINYTHVGAAITPASNFSGTLIVPVTVNDGTEDSATFEVNVTVTPVNDAPAITGQVVLGTPEDTLLTLTLADLAVADPDNTYPTGFSLNVSDGTNYTHVGAAITPAADFNGILTVPVTVNDGTNDSEIFEVSVTVTPINDPPAITGQTALNMQEDTMLTLTLADLTVTDVDNAYPVGFTLSISDGANYTHAGADITPTLNFDGILTVPVTVNDGASDSATFDVIVTVTGENDSPVIDQASPQALLVPMNTTVHLDLTATDPEGDTLAWSILTPASNGTASIDPDGQATYTPNNGYTGLDKFEVQVDDSGGGTGTLTVDITVNTDRVPVIAQSGPLMVIMSEDGTPIAWAAPTLSATDPDFTDTLTWSVSAQASNGVATVSGTGASPSVFNYTPADNWNGTDTFTVQVSDGNGGIAEIDVQVSVIAVNDPPVITGQVLLSMPEDTTLTLTLDDLTVTDVDNSYPVGFSLNVLDGINYAHVGAAITPAPNFNGTLTVPVVVNDGTNDSASFEVSVTVTAVNDSPVITGQVPLSTPEDTPLTIAFSDLTVTDADNTYPSDFSLHVADGTNYTHVGGVITPASNFNGILTVLVYVNDGTYDSATFGASVSVTAVNDVPAIAGQATLSTPEDTPLTLTLADLTVTDVDNTYPTGFSLNVLDGTNYTHVGPAITPAANVNGTLTVPVTVNDGTDDSAPFNVRVTVTAVNDPPVITGQATLSTQEDTSLTLTLGDLTVTDVDNTYPAGFSLAVLAGANYTFAGATITPNPDFDGILTVPVTVNDGTNDSAEFSVSIAVTAINDAPVITGQATLSTPEDTPLTLTFDDLTVTDVDNAYPTGFSLSVADGANYTHVGAALTPAANFSGTLTVPVTVNDGTSDSASFEITVTVTAVNDAPVINGQSFLSTPEDTPLTLTLANLTVTDADNTYPTGFSLSVADGTNYTHVDAAITPTANFSGILSVPVTVNDGTSHSASFEVSVTVTAINDAPIITGQAALSTPEDTLLTLTLADLVVADVDNAYPTGFSLSVSDGTNYTHVGAAITPAANFNGILTVPVTVNDGTDDSATFEVSVTVTAVNDQPVITGHTALSTPEDTPLTLTLADLTVTDADNAYPTGFSLNILGGTNYTHLGVAITPAANFNGTLTVPVTVNDGTDDSATFEVSVTVTAVNDQPVITGQAAFSTPEDTLLTLTLADLVVADVDNAYPTGFSLSVSDGTNYTHVGAAITPASNFNGTLTVPVTVNDGTSDSAIFDVEITVTPVNDAPVIDQENPYVLLAPMDTTVELALTATEPDGDTLAWSILTSASNGTASVGSSDGLVTYTPNPSYVGPDTFVVQVDDSAGGTDTLTVNVTVNTDQLPVIAQAGPLEVTMSEDGSPTAWAAPTVSATDLDAGDTLTWSVSTPATQGVATVTGTGASPIVFNYAPAANWNGIDTFTVQVSDGNGGIDQIDVNVTVTPVNDPPVLNPIGARQTAEGQLLEFTISGTDPDGDGVSYDVTPLPAGASIDPVTGIFQWTPGLVDEGGHDLQFSITDDGTPPLSTTETVHIEVANIFIGPEGGEFNDGGTASASIAPALLNASVEFHIAETLPVLPGGASYAGAVEITATPAPGWTEGEDPALDGFVMTVTTPLSGSFTSGTLLEVFREGRFPGQWIRQEGNATVGVSGTDAQFTAYGPGVFIVRAIDSLSTPSADLDALTDSDLAGYVPTVGYGLHRITGTGPVPIILFHDVGAQVYSQPGIPACGGVNCGDYAQWDDFIAWAGTNTNLDLTNTYQLWWFVYDGGQPLGYYQQDASAPAAGLENATYLLASELERTRALATDPFPDEPVQFLALAHGAGGLLIRNFMEHWPTGGDQVLAAITLSTPHHGTPEAVLDWTLQTVRQNYPFLASPAMDMATGNVNWNWPAWADLAWDNADGTDPFALGIPDAAFDFTTTLNSVTSTAHVLSTNDAGWPTDAGVTDPDLHLPAPYAAGRAAGTTLWDLDQANTYQDKLLLYAAYLYDPAADFQTSDWTSWSAAPDPARQAMRGALLSTYASASNGVWDFSINDGWVPLQSALMLDPSGSEPLCPVFAWFGRTPVYPIAPDTAAIDTRLRLNNSGHYRLFGGYSHREMVLGRVDDAYPGNDFDLFVQIANDLDDSVASRPVAALAYVALGNSQVDVDASASYDTDTGLWPFTALSYRIDWGDTPSPQWSAWTSSPLMTHFYSANGDYTVLVQVRDADGMLDTISGAVTALDLQGPETDPPSAGTFLPVPAGDFEMGKGSTLRSVTLSAYSIGEFEITNLQFAQLLNWALANGKLPDYAGGNVTCCSGTGDTTLMNILGPACQVHYSNNRFVVENRDGFSMMEHPVVEVTWTGAVLYCNWLSEAVGLTPCYQYDFVTSAWKLLSPVPNGYRLPTDAEWERAAGWDAATSTNWPYAFDRNNLSTAYCNVNNVNPLVLYAKPYTTPIGYYDGVNPFTKLAQSPIGAYDMTGNVLEWCYDWYTQTLPTDPSPLVDWTGPETGITRVVRGGGWATISPVACQTTERQNAFPTYSSDSRGFRIAQNP